LRENIFHVEEQGERRENIKEKLCCFANFASLREKLFHAKAQSEHQGSRALQCTNDLQKKSGNISVFNPRYPSAI
jgi:hypothetical protein